MNNWLIMFAVMAILSLIYPPVLGVFLGMGMFMAASYVVYKSIGG